MTDVSQGKFPILNILGYVKSDEAPMTFKVVSDARGTRADIRDTALKL